MNHETTLRAVLGVGFLAVLMITLYHRLRSWASKEPLDRRQEGLFVLATLRLVGLLLWMSSLGPSMRPDSIRAYVPHGDRYRLRPDMPAVDDLCLNAQGVISEFDEVIGSGW